MPEIIVCQVGDVAPGSSIRVDTAGHRIAIVRIGNDWYAIADRCSHASAVGPIDTDQLYYLATRGVPPDVAERLIVFGFFEDAIDRLAFSAGAERLRSAVARKFDSRRCCHPDESAAARAERLRSA